MSTETVLDLSRGAPAAVDAIRANLTLGAAMMGEADWVSRMLGRYAREVARIGEAADRAGHATLQALCSLLEANLLTLQSEDRGLTAGEQALLSESPDLLACCLAAPEDPNACNALIRHLEDERWSAPLAREDAEQLRALLRSVHGVPEDYDLEFASSPEALLAITPEVEDAAQAMTVEEWPSDELIADASGDDATVQQVSEEFVAMLGAELSGTAKHLTELLAAAAAGDAGSDAGREALANYAEQMERLGVAADAVGLSALSRLLAHVRAHVSSASEQGALAPEQRAVLEMLPGLLGIYLTSPNDMSVCEGLVDFLRSSAWGQRIEPESASQLAKDLASVKLVKEAQPAEPRQSEARAEDVSLSVPADINPELLDGLLQELPVQTAEFSQAIQQIVSGAGSLREVDVAKRAAHTLKGAAHTVGVMGIANLTHHVEDILIAVTKQGTLPSRPLCDALSSAADCLEAMSEALLGVSPAPADAVSVLQQVLDWANRIDREGIPAGDESIAPESQTAIDSNAQELSSQQASSGPMLRVPASLVDELLRIVGETIISNAQIKERLRVSMEQTRAVLRQSAQLQSLSAELEHLVDIRGIAAPAHDAGAESDFDPLEFEHYSELHTVTRRLIEAATDSREITTGAEEQLAALGDLLDVQGRLHAQSQQAVMKTRMVPVATVVSRLQRSVRQTSRLLDKQVELTVSGADTTIDANVLNELVDPLMHALRNAVDHGIEAPAKREAAGKPRAGRIELAFAREGNAIVVRCQDDGAGLDLAAVRETAEKKGLITPEQTLTEEELARLILLPGFSTRTEATQVSGRGIGLDAVYSQVLALKGTLNLHSQPGSGMRIELRLPVSLISTHGLLVRSRDKKFAVSSHGLEAIHYVTTAQVMRIGTTIAYQAGEQIYELQSLEQLLNLPEDRRMQERAGFPVLLARTDAGALRALRIQEVLESRELVVKDLGRYVRKSKGVIGATILGDGSVAPVIDLPELLRSQSSLTSTATGATTNMPVGVKTQFTSELLQQGRTALVVDDSLSARRAAAQLMKDAGFEVRTAIDGLDAVAQIEKKLPDIVLADMEMPRMNGLELATHLRNREQSKQIPIVMITSRSTDKHRAQAQAAGVNVYLTKPFSDEELLKHVAVLTHG